MKKVITKIGIAMMCGLMLFSTTGCNMSNTGKGALIGGGGGGALGAGLGALIGKNSNNSGKGAAIGAAVGTAVGAGVGALIGNHMDKKKKQLEEELGNNATVEETTDQNGLKAVKVTFDGGILFPTGKWTINNSAQSALTQFASSLVSDPNTNVNIYGYTDNTGTMAANQKVSTNRANAVKDYLQGKGVAVSRLTAEGIPMADYVASNDTKEGRAQNRRVEVYISANEEMIQQAENGTLK